MAEKKYEGFNFLTKEWEQVDKETYNTLLDPARRCTTPVSTDVKDGKELYKRFYTEISEVLVINNVAERRVSKIAKQCAIIHCRLMIEKVPVLATHYQNLIKQIEAL